MEGVGIWYVGFWGTEVQGSSREMHFVSPPGVVSGFWATWISMTDFTEILASLEIPPDVTEVWNESLMP